MKITVVIEGKRDIEALESLFFLKLTKFNSIKVNSIEDINIHYKFNHFLYKPIHKRAIKADLFKNTDLVVITNYIK